MKKKKNLKKLLNLGFVDYTNLTPKYGELDMPYVRCKVLPKIDYLATYSQPNTYHKTSNTALSFFEYDIITDGLYGIWNAIYYGVKELQDYYKERFKGIKYFIAPDFSKCGDISELENWYRQFKSRIVSIWLTIELNAIVIPFISCANMAGMKYMLDGMQDCNVVAFNAKGIMNNSEQLSIFTESIKFTVDTLKNLKMIIVYSSSPNIAMVRKIFQYAIEAGINVIIPDNMLQSRNRLIGGENDGCN